MLFNLRNQLKKSILFQHLVSNILQILLSIFVSFSSCSPDNKTSNMLSTDKNIDKRQNILDIIHKPKKKCVLISLLSISIISALFNITYINENNSYSMDEFIAETNVINNTLTYSQNKIFSVYNKITKCEDLISFEKYLPQLPKDLTNYTYQIPSDYKKYSKKKQYAEEYLRNIYPYIICNPSSENLNYYLRKDKNAENIDCKNPYLNGLFTEKREKPAFVIDMTSIAYELDILEIRLHETFKIVDQYILFESIYGQRLVKKPLFFNDVKDVRFNKFLDKIYHVILDDETFYREYHSELEREKKPNHYNTKHDWRGENIMRTYPWDKFLKTTKNLNLSYFLDKNANKYDNETILLIVGDLDEIIDSKTLAYLKYCKPRSENFHFPIKIEDIHAYQWNFENKIKMKVTTKIYNIGTSGKPYDGNFFRKNVNPYKINPITNEDKRSLFFMYHLNRLNNDFSINAKQLLLAESVGISSLDPIKSFKERHKYPYHKALNKRQVFKKVNITLDPIPLYALCNKQRFPYMFPKDCISIDIEQFPLKYECKNNSFCNYYNI